MTKVEYEILLESLIKDCSSINKRVVNAIKKANVNSSSELIDFLKGFTTFQFGKIREKTQKTLDIFDSDAKNVSFADNLKTNSKIAQTIKNQTYIELNSNLVCAEKELMSNFKKIIKPFSEEPTNIITVKKALQTGFISNGGVGITYRNGAKVPLDKYFMMATRTARNETQNLTAIDDAKRLETDLVYLQPNNASSCPTCSTLGGRVYSISGKDKRYPALYDKLFKNGYHCIHPHCRCQVRPFFEEFHTKKQNNEFLKQSNREWNLDERTELQRENYQRAQAFNHRVWEATKEFNKAKVELGKDLPSQLGTLPKFRTGHAKQTPRYQEVHKTLNAIDNLYKSNPISITKLKSSLYSNISCPIKSRNVIITQKQFDRHIAPGANNHNDIYLRVKDKLPQIINNPDYIFKDKSKSRPNTLLVVSKQESVNIILKISITKRLSNSIITIIPCGEKRLKQMIKNNKCYFVKRFLIEFVKNY